MKRLTVDEEQVGQNGEIYVRLDGTLVMFRDITERKKRESELLAKVGELTTRGSDHQPQGADR